MTLRIDVAAGILVDAAGRVLIAARNDDGPFVGLYEFPGGKIVRGESAQAALQRELAEEIGVETLTVRRFMAVQHDYADRSVSIDFFFVDSWRGTPVGREGQELRWVAVADLDADELLPADAPVVDALQAAWA